MPTVPNWTQTLLKSNQLSRERVIYISVAACGCYCFKGQVGNVVHFQRSRNPFVALLAGKDEYSKTMPKLCILFDIDTFRFKQLSDIQ